MVASRGGLRQIFGECPTHGLALHRVRDGACLSCAPGRGRPKTAASIARREAIDRRELFYKACCAIHGETDHHVKSYRCFTCYTANGIPRVGVRQK